MNHHAGGLRNQKMKEETMSDRVEGESYSQNDELDQTQQALPSTESLQWQSEDEEGREYE